MTLSIETERLRIRPFVADDWRAVHAYAADPATMHFQEAGPLTAEETEAYVARNVGDGAQSYAVEHRADGTLIGHMPFHLWFGERTYEIGWTIAPPHQHQGYATEAARALLRYGFETLGLHRIIATCQPENPASWRVMEKLRMRREAHFVRALHKGGDVWWDEYFYAILADEWRARGETNGS
jgi:[ribosomal protein S5]-alanine N-acetyltransferase